jgi:hypothetical protein
VTERSTRWKRFRRRWDLHFRVIDQLIGVTIGVALGWALLLRDPRWASAFVARRSDGLFTAGSAVTGVLLGLELTSLAILADHLGRRRARATEQPDTGDRVRIEAGAAHQLVDGFTTATKYLGLATVTALVGLVASGVIAVKVVLGAWVIAATIAIVTFARSVSLLRAVIRSIINQS